MADPATILAVIGLGSNLLQGQQAAADAEKQAARIRKALPLRRRAAKLQGELTSIANASSRKQFVTNARKTEAGFTSAVSTGGLKGSSIAASGKASLRQQESGQMGFSLLTDDFGAKISTVMQQAADIEAGVGEPVDKGILGGAMDTAGDIVEGIGDFVQDIGDDLFDGINETGDKIADFFGF